MFRAASCSNIFSATGTGAGSLSRPGVARAQPGRMTGAAPESAHSGPLGNPMNMMMVPAPVPPGCAREDLMTRRQVASLFRVTSAAVASWARRGRLPEVRDEAGPGTGARMWRRCSATVRGGGSDDRRRENARPGKQRNARHLDGPRQCTSSSRLAPRGHRPDAGCAAELTRAPDRHLAGRGHRMLPVRPASFGWSSSAGPVRPVDAIDARGWAAGAERGQPPMWLRPQVRIWLASGFSCPLSR